MKQHPTTCTARATVRALGVAAVLGLAAACQPPMERVQQRTAGVSVPDPASLDYNPAADLGRHAVAAFVAPLVDDGEPARFTDLYRTLTCADHSSVMVNGGPVIEGDLVPPGAFVLQWDLDLYCPFGISGPLLNGRAEVLVFRDDEYGMTALLRPVSLDVLEPPLLLDDAATRSATADAELAAAVRTVSGR